MKKLVLIATIMMTSCTTYTMKRENPFSADKPNHNPAPKSSRLMSLQNRAHISHLSGGSITIRDINRPKNIPVIVITSPNKTMRTQAIILSDCTNRNPLLVPRKK